MMSPELRARWAAALREPGRVQGHEALCTITPDGTKRQCCLDVLVELYQADHPEGTSGHLEVIATPGGDVIGYRDTERPNLSPETALLPLKVAQWAGTQICPQIGQDSAPYLNDNRRLPFTAIADLIDNPENKVS